VESLLPHESEDGGTFADAPKIIAHYRILPRSFERRSGPAGRFARTGDEDSSGASRSQRFP
jgi:hypothetical protein